MTLFVLFSTVHGCDHAISLVCVFLLLNRGNVYELPFFSRGIFLLSLPPFFALSLEAWPGLLFLACLLRLKADLRLQ